MSRKTYLVTVDEVPVANLRLSEEGVCNLIAHRISENNAFLSNPQVSLAPESVQPINNEGFIKHD